MDVDRSVLMLWFYIGAFMMLVGGELNALLWEARTEATTGTEVAVSRPEPTYDQS